MIQLAILPNLIHAIDTQTRRTSILACQLSQLLCAHHESKSAHLNAPIRTFHGSNDGSLEMIESSTLY